MKGKQGVFIIVFPYIYCYRTEEVGQIPEMNVAGRRNRYDIIAEILSVARGGARVSRIMHRSNLDFRQKERYIGHLLGTGLLRVRTSSPLVYETTELGDKWMENYRKVAL